MEKYIERPLLPLSLSFSLSFAIINPKSQQLLTALVYVSSVIHSSFYISPHIDDILVVSPPKYKSASITYEKKQLINIKLKTQWLGGELYKIFAVAYCSRD